MKTDTEDTVKPKRNQLDESSDSHQESEHTDNEDKKNMFVKRFNESPDDAIKTIRKEYLVKRLKERKYKWILIPPSTLDMSAVIQRLLSN